VCTVPSTAVTNRVSESAFTEFARRAEPRLKIALCAAFGPEVGMDSTSYALAYGWEHWERIRSLPNPVGYLWGVGRNHARRLHKRRRSQLHLFESVSVEDTPWVEPGLPAALAGLTEQQRTAVVLVKGMAWTLAEVADLMQVAVPTVQTHLERGMKRLRRDLGA
jgi:DNA-directed RNA polymerase specialized sigma24 family protein